MPELTERSRDIARKLELVVQTGLLLNKALDPEGIVQSATYAGMKLCGAQFGAFYNVVDKAGESYILSTLTAVDRQKFSQFSMPRNTAVFAPTFDRTGIVRSPDITKDPRYGHDAPYFGLPMGHLPFRSYLAVQVKGSTGEVLGGLFYGHEEVGVFEKDAEDLVATVAAQAAVAIENTRLRNELTSKIDALNKIQKIQMNASKRLGEMAAIVESSDDAIISKNLDGIITSWNEAATRILGYTREEMIGQSILKLIPEHLRGDEKIIIGKIRAGERIEHFETIRLKKSGELLNVSLTVSPVKDDTGEIIGASKILRDITGQKQIEKSLLQSEKIAATGRMAATIAHEINNPLAAVVNLLYLLRPMITDPDGLSYLSAAESELNRVSHIAKQTLGFYREHASAAKSTISALVADAITIYGPRCAAANIKIEKSLESSKEILLRKGEMMQVISNLIVNAVYAMPNGGTLRICVKDTEIPKDGVLFIIEDTGIGITPENLPRIFDAFFTTRKTIGTGIGLFVAKQFVEGHGGEMKVRSSVAPETHGTGVYTFLPQHTAYEDAPENPQ